MIVRAIDGANDWLFGKSKNDYLTGIPAIAQTIKCRLQSFLNDCFWATNAGLDWFNLLGAKDKLNLQLRIAAEILNTPEGAVTGIDQVLVSLNADRNIVVEYRAQTIYSQAIFGQFTYDFSNGA